MERKNRIEIALHRASKWILNLQCEDGGFPFSSRERTSAGAWPTSQAISALLSYDSAFLPSIDKSLEWLQRTHTDYTWGPMKRGTELMESTVWVALAFKIANDIRGDYFSTLKKIITKMEMSVNDDGGWGSWKGDASRTIITSNILTLFRQLNLSKTDLNDQAYCNAAIHFLLGRQNSDGGWGFRSEENSNVLSTAYALIALSGIASCNDMILRGIEWLVAEKRKRHRSDEQLFKQESIWREDNIQRWSYFELPVLLDALALSSKGFEVFSDLRYLLSLQEADGSWINPDEPYLAFHTYLTVYFLAKIAELIDLDQFERYCNTLDLIQNQEHDSLLLASRNKLKRLILEDALRVNEDGFVLSSGSKSKFYYDLKKVLLDPVSISLIGKIIWEKIKFYSIDSIGGPESGAIPIATAVARESYEANMPLNAFFVRKAPKAYGTRVWLEGKINRGDRVILVEDVVTSGGSLEKAIQRLQEYNCKIQRIIAIVDREEGAAERFSRMGIEFDRLFRHSEFEVML